MMFDRLGNSSVDMLVGEAIACNHQPYITGVDDRSEDVGVPAQQGHRSDLCCLFGSNNHHVAAARRSPIERSVKLDDVHLVGEPSLCSRVDDWLHRECGIISTDIRAEPALARAWNETRQDSAGRTRDMLVVEMPFEEKVLIQSEQISRTVSLVALSEEAEQQF